MSLLDRRLFMAVAWATLLTAGAWCSNAAAQLPLCNSKTTKAAKDCGTGSGCPKNPTKGAECYVVMVEQQPNFTPCTGGTDSERCEAVNNFVCTKSWYCEPLYTVNPEGGTTVECVKSPFFPKDGNGDQIISTDTSGTLVSCRRPGSS